MQKSTFWLVLLAAAVFLPLAAGAVTVTESVTLVLLSDSTSYTLSPSNFDTLTVNNSSFDFALSGGSQVNLSFAGEKTYTTSGGSSFSSAMQITRACGSSASTITVKVDAGAGSDTVTVTPSGACSGASSGGGGGPVSTGGGGGGGSSAPTIPAQVAQAPTPVPSPAPAPSSTFASDLELGMSSDDVLRLQALLASNKEIYPEGLVTGYYGSLTREAVRRFQAKYGLAQVGRVGPQTRAKLDEVFGKATPTAPKVAKPSPVALAVSPVFSSGLALGSRSDDVKRLQQLLNSSSDTQVVASGPGSPGGETNYFGAATRRAVEKFQEKYGVAKAGEAGYGYLGPKTRAKLQEVFGGAPAPALPTPSGVGTPTPPKADVGAAPAPSTPSDELPWFLRLTPVTPAQ